MTPRMNDNLLKALFIFVIFTVLLLQTLFTSACSLTATPASNAPATTHFIA